jgi:hypothetical protein
MGLNTIRGHAVMRRASLASSVEQSTGCRGVFPLALEQSANTITQAEYDSLTFTYPASKPIWESFTQQPATPTSIVDGYEGYIYKLDVGQSPGNFDWLKWNTNISGITPPPSGQSLLGASLLWPGNNGDVLDRNDPPDPPPPSWPFPFTFRGFVEVGDDTDTDMQMGDWVARDTVSGGFGASGVTTSLESHIYNGRSLRVALWDSSAGGYEPSPPAPAARFLISGFAVFRVRAYGSGWILFELVRLDTSCGQQG